MFLQFIAASKCHVHERISVSIFSSLHSWLFDDQSTRTEHRVYPRSKALSSVAYVSRKQFLIVVAAFHTHTVLHCTHKI